MENAPEKKYPLLKNTDIEKNPYAYDPETIEWNIRNSFLSMRTLVRYQKLTPYICAKYVVFGGRNEMYADCTEDAWIGTHDILLHQPHITLEEMHEAHSIANEEDDEEDEREWMQKEDKRNPKKKKNGKKTVLYF